MRYAFFTVLAFLTIIFGMKAQAPEQVRIYLDDAIADISELFWGTNFLFWIEDDASLSDGKIEKAMKGLPIRLLRYPGGTVADNFHWETNRLDNRFMFPYEEGQGETDFDEFMAFCTNVDAEPMLVVNTQSWALKNDLRSGAAEAARWVKYCKEKGYNVRYWEIGNETYWHPVMTASEYGHLVNVYADAMRAENPDIILSVNGGWDISMTGNKERTDSSKWHALKAGYEGISSVEDYKTLKSYADSVVVRPWTEGKDKWWHDLITVCGENIDMVSVHWYYHDNVIKHIDQKISELKQYLKSLVPGKDYLFCLSEFNCNTKDFDLRVSGLAESVGRFLNAGIDLACFWPFRIGGNPSVEVSRSMLSVDGKDYQYPYLIFQLLQHEMKGSMLRCDCPGNLYAFASRESENVSVVLSGRCLDERSEVVVDFGDEDCLNINDAVVFKPDPEAAGGLSICKEDVKNSDHGIIVGVEPASFVLLTLSLRQGI